MNNLKRLNDTPSTMMYCGLCPDGESKEIEFDCVECEMYLCLSHSQEHNKCRIWKNHTLQNLTTMKMENDSLQTEITDIYFQLEYLKQNVKNLGLLVQFSSLEQRLISINEWIHGGQHDSFLPRKDD